MIETSRIPSPQPASVIHHRLPVGGPSSILHIYLSEGNDYIIQPKTGLSSSSNYVAYYLGASDSRPASFELVEGPAADGSCGFWEINRQIMPGLYGLQVPWYQRPGGHTFVNLHFVGASPLYLVLHGVEYDPYDSFALGLASWVRSTCHEHLTSGLRKSMPATLRPLLADWFNRDP